MVVLLPVVISNGLRVIRKKSPIHENADAKITCDFGDGDISRFRSRLPTHTHMATSFALAAFETSIRQMVAPFCIVCKCAWVSSNCLHEGGLTPGGRHAPGYPNCRRRAYHNGFGLSPADRHPNFGCFYDNTDVRFSEEG